MSESSKQFLYISVMFSKLGVGNCSSALSYPQLKITIMKKEDQNTSSDSSHELNSPLISFDFPLLFVLVL